MASTTGDVRQAGTAADAVAERPDGYPWWSLVIVAIDVLILYGLTARWRGAVTAA